MKPIHLRKKSIIILGVLFYLISFMKVSSAQQERSSDNQEIWIKQLLNEYYVPDNLEARNKTHVYQEGSGNDIFVNQVNQGTIDEQNVIYALQKGNNNLNYVLQNGIQNEYAGFQFGNNNKLDLEMLGMNNKSTLYQKGDYNKVTQEMKGSDMRYMIIQEGINNELVHQETGEFNPEYKIHMKGNGMKLYIRNSNIYK